MKNKSKAEGLKHKGKKYLKYIWSKVIESIRIRLMLTAVISVILSVLAVFIVNYLLFFQDTGPKQGDLYNLDRVLRDMVQTIRYETNERSLGDLKKIHDIMDKKIKYSSLDLQHINAYIIDLDGNMLLKSESSSEDTDGIEFMIKDALNSKLRSTGKISRNYYVGNEVVFVERLDFEDGKGIYAIMEGLVKRKIKVFGWGILGAAIPLAVGAVTFVLTFFFLTKREVEYIEELSCGISEISKGNLNYRVKKKTKDELGFLANNINYMVEELKTKIEDERKAEKAKNELITNMSHDLRTPLTSIMGYLRMLKDKKYENEVQLREYIDIAYNKSDRLKLLIDDLFMYSKLANEDTKLYMEKVYLNDLVIQLIGELAPVADENELDFIKDIQAEKIMVDVDTDKIVRVFENIFANAIRHSYKPGAIIVSMFSNSSDMVTVAISNRGDIVSQEDLSRLFDRLYMIDKSRSSASGGSGLGLAIAKSIVKLHGGEIWAESKEQEITFFVRLPRI